MKKIVILVLVLLLIYFIGSIVNEKEWGEIRYTHSKTNVRESNSKYSNIIDKLEHDKKIKTVRSNDDWWLVYELKAKNSSKENAIGYVHKSLLHTKPMLKQKGYTTNAKANTTTPQIITNTNKWYQGGNLHNATIIDWKNATNANKLATASDWLVATKWKGHLKTPEDLNKVKVKSQMLVNAIDDVVDPLDRVLDSLQINEMAAYFITVTNDLGPY